MSYCRMYNSDVYCYADVAGGWTTHVAHRGPCSGETYNDCTLTSFRARLTTLRAAGYDIPEFVFDRIDEEILSAKST